MGERRRVLVYGWYHQDNLGDDLFAEAFELLFPDFSFTFTNCLTVAQAESCDALILGGGSFLDNPVRHEPGATEAASRRPVMYVGVGLETEVHPDHRRLISSAKLVAARSRAERVPGALPMPDLVTALQAGRRSEVPKTLLFLPNVAVLPTRADPQWKHAAWAYFASECSQFLDELVQDGWRVSLMAMCRSAKLDDEWASSAIVSQMASRERAMLRSERPAGGAEALRMFSSYAAVVTQRFHGVVLAELAGTPCVSVAHHDKLWGRSDGTSAVPFYGTTKAALRRALDEARPAAPPSEEAKSQLGVVCEAVRKIVEDG